MREDVSFKTSDNVTLRGWFYQPDPSADADNYASPPHPPLPCLVMCHGFSAVKEMHLDKFAEHFTSCLPLTCLVYDHRGFGTSGTKEGQPRLEIIPAQQLSDFADAITYAQLRPETDADRIGIWGTSYAGGHALWLGAVDRRVKAVLSQVPLVDGWANMDRLIRSDSVPTVNLLFQEDRIVRARGEVAGTMPVVDADLNKPSAVPTLDAFKYFDSWGGKTTWRNEVTVKSLEALREYVPSAHIHHISPTPLLMTVADSDVLTPADLILEAYNRALEPKRLQILRGGHFDVYRSPNFEKNVRVQTDFLQEFLCS